MRFLRLLSLCILFLPISLASESATVYLVLGSDTAIWNGMSTSRYHCTYDPSLYTNPAQNANIVMSPSFRNQFVDSYGTPLKMTWWMMAGNIFRHATNTDIPIPNIMTLYHMKNIYGENVRQVGDELSLHYHTFVWSDYDQDGLYYWNQAESFLESKDDFDVTLAQFLIEENTFPVSFRSGWHYMDNAWQNYLNDILPFSMHNDYPNMNTDETEPLDNLYDWSQAPAEFVPYQPSEENYQLPGGSDGWNVRSAHFFSVRYHNLMDTLFAAANAGKDQVACLWGHLPETDFLTNIEIIDSLAHQVSAEYPEVTFRYCTAIEAMQRWMGTTDTTGPEVTVTEQSDGENLYYTISADEPIFQPAPIVAYKNIYEEYTLLEMENTGSLAWRTTTPVNQQLAAKLGIAITDTAGNLTTTFVRHVQDDQYIDNTDPAYQEVYGPWGNATSKTWGTNARIATITPGDSVVASWTPEITQSGNYGIFYQVPAISDPATESTIQILDGNLVLYTDQLGELTFHQWKYIATVMLPVSPSVEIRMTAHNPATNTESVKMITDVLRVTPLVTQRALHVPDQLLDLGIVSQDDTTTVDLVLENQGYEPLTLSNITSEHQSIIVSADFPVEIPEMSSVTIPIQFYHDVVETVSDSLIIFSNDPRDPEKPLPFIAHVEPFFTITDNEDSGSYSEFGTWQTSVAQAYGSSSRFAHLDQSPLASATFECTLSRPGIYEIYEIVPSTVNSTDNAKYIIKIDGAPVDSILINQNTDSGGWVSLGRFQFPEGVPVQVEVRDTGESTEGVVLRADAIKFSLVEEMVQVTENPSTAPTAFQLAQNYPNPFNGSTTIPYGIPRQTRVEISIFDIRGQRIRTLINVEKSPGMYSTRWVGRDDAGNMVGSGIYYAHIRAGDFQQSRKVLLIK